MASVIQSVLKESIKALPEDKVIKPQSVLPELLKKGVKQEELEFSGFKVPAGSDPKGRVTKSDLLDAESKRIDEFGVEDGGEQYLDFAAQPAARNNPTYREKVYTFKQGEGESRYTSSHYPDTENYLAHTRTYDTPVGGSNTRVLMEIQSDLHQTGRQTGYDKGLQNLSPEVKKEADAAFKQIKDANVFFEFADAEDAAEQGVTLIAKSDEEADKLIVEGIKKIEELTGVSLEGVDDYSYHSLDSLLDAFEITTENVPSSPYEKTWLKKTIEKEYVEALNNGVNQLAIPISGLNLRGQLQRAEGVQKWYETTVTDTVKKVAKQTNSDFKLVTEGGTHTTAPFVKLYGATIARDVDAVTDRFLEDVFETASAHPAQLNYYIESIPGIEPGEVDSVARAVLNAVRDSDDAAYSRVMSDLDLRVSRGFSDYAETIRKNPSTTYAVITPRGEKLVKPAITKEMIDSDIARYNEANKNIIKGVDGAKEAKKAIDAEIKEKYGISNAGDLRVQPNEFVRSASEEITRPNQISVSMYSSPAAVVFATGIALQQGNSDEEVAAYLEQKGYDYAEIQPLVEFAAKAEAEGYTKEEIEEYLNAKDIQAEQTESLPAKLYDQSQIDNDLRLVKSTQRYGAGERATAKQIEERYNMSVEEFVQVAENNPESISYAAVGDTPKALAYNTLMSGDISQMTPSEFVSAAEVVYPTMTSTLMTNVPAMFGNEAAAQRYNAAIERQSAGIIQMANEKYGIVLAKQDGEWYVKGPEGVVMPATPSLWETIKASKGEMVGGTAGAITGSIMGAKKMPAIIPYAKTVGALGGGMMGGVLGAVAGTEFDYMQRAMQLNVEMEATAMAHKAMTASELAIVGEAIGYPVAKGLGLGWKGIVRAKNLIFDGNTQGAYKALKEVSFLDDSQIQEIVDNLSDLAAVEGSKEQKAIIAVMNTEPGMQGVIEGAAASNPQVAKAVIKSATNRADDLLKTTADLSDPNVARRFTADLNNYVSDVKKNYNTVKAKAVTAPRSLDFSFDYKDLAIDPVLERLEKQITDPTVSAKYLLQAQRVRSMSESRSFGDLIELRQIVNDFLFNKKISKAEDAKMLRGVINSIDDKITEGAHQVLDNPGKWLDEWAGARTQYSQMKRVEETSMYKAIFDKKGKLKPVKPEDVVKTFGKYITALDGSFETIMSKIPISGRATYEGAVVDALANKYTVNSGGAKAIDFPKLADDLAKVNFTTKEVRQTKAAIQQMSEVFKNDLALFSISHNIGKQQISQGLTDNIVSKAKYELAASTYARLKQTFLPGSGKNRADLLKQTAKLMESPLNAKAIGVLREEFAMDPRMLKTIEELTQNAVRMAAKDDSLETPMIKLYGSGNTRTFKGAGETSSVPAHRVATLDQVQKIAEAEAVTVDSPSLDSLLKKYGYVAVVQGSDRVRLLK